MRPFYELIRRLHRERKMTILLVSHDLSVVRDLADVVFCLQAGRVVQSGVPQVVLTEAQIAVMFQPQGQPIACEDPTHAGCVHF
jgi:ABC-type glutathione transport system ATPase component